MHNKPLTETFATRAKCPEGRRDIIFFDADMHGFGLRVHKPEREISLHTTLSIGVMEKSRLTLLKHVYE